MEISQLNSLNVYKGNKMELHLKLHDMVYLLGTHDTVTYDHL